jgi:hypothetical protein
MDNMKASLYDELKYVFEKLSKQYTKMLLYFISRVFREDIFKPTIRYETLRDFNNNNNNNGIRAINFAPSKNLTVKSSMFPHR